MPWDGAGMDCGAMPWDGAGMDCGVDVMMLQRKVGVLQRMLTPACHLLVEMERAASENKAVLRGLLELPCARASASVGFAVCANGAWWQVGETYAVYAPCCPGALLCTCRLPAAVPRLRCTAKGLRVASPLLFNTNTVVSLAMI